LGIKELEQSLYKSIKKTKFFSILINKFSIYVIVFVLFIIGIIISEKFLTYQNLLNIINSISLLGIVTIGVAFVTYSGHFLDLSVSAIMAFSGIVTIISLRFGLPIGILLGMLAGMFLGFINGLVVGYLEVNPIIWTLSIQFLVSGFMQWIWGGNLVYPYKGTPESVATVETFINISRKNVFGNIPLIALILVIITIFGYVLMSKTKFGIRLKLVGSSLTVAKMTGINVGRIVVFAFITSASMASIAGILLASLIKVGAYYTGEGYGFNALIAVVIGGITLNGGKGNIIGVIGGILIIGLLSNISTLLGISVFAQSIVKGVVFLIVVGFSSYLERSKS